nr:PREDICTED: lysosomal amino acid transporter 1 homolog [Latimeria chalumnae]|eukprot:XP_014348919.1 PREDICTED: lysosomal amino acid transporter 1 homolog [Latimeria chalumnae]
MDGKLTRGTLGSLFPHGNFTVDCPNGSRWAWNIFYECAIDDRDMTSIIMGLLSILCFMLSSLPQFYRSWRAGNMDKALSLWFLLGWLGGDSCNLIGSFLADQLPLQVKDSTMINAACLLVVLGMVGTSPWLQRTDSQSLGPVEFKRRTLLSTAADKNGCEAFTTKEIIGFVIGSVSSLLYLSSRIPQIYTNFLRKSTEGVSFSLFAFIILGNIAYGLSVLLKNPDRGQAESNYVVHHIPWVVGSLGTLTLDTIIACQFLIYRKRTKTGTKEERSPLIGNGTLAREIL